MDVLAGLCPSRENMVRLGTAEKVLKVLIMVSSGPEASSIGLDPFAPSVTEVGAVEAAVVVMAVKSASSSSSSSWALSSSSKISIARFRPSLSRRAASMEMSRVTFPVATSRGGGKETGRAEGVAAAAAAGALLGVARGLLTLTGNLLSIPVLRGLRIRLTAADGTAVMALVLPTLLASESAVSPWVRVSVKSLNGVSSDPDMMREFRVLHGETFSWLWIGASVEGVGELEAEAGEMVFILCIVRKNTSRRKKHACLRDD